MTHWPELLAVTVSAALCLTSVLLADPPTTVQPWCPPVDAPGGGCSVELCRAMEQAECERYSGPGAVAMNWCKR